MEDNVSLRQQFREFNKGNIIDSDGSKSDYFNFYDWFCPDKALKAKSIRLYKATQRFCEKFNVDLDTHYVFFKNNCPMVGPLYDDFRICDIKTGEVVYNVTPKSGHSDRAEIYCRKNGFEKPLHEGKTLSEIYSNLK